MIAIVASIIFILGYLSIAFESRLRVNKSAVALAMGGALWALLGFYNSELVQEEIVHVSFEIFSVVIFLLAAMSLVEILVHYRLFDVIRGKIFQYKLDDQQQFVIITAVAFVLSAVIDNLTATIVMIQIATRFFKGQNLLVAAVGVVIAANAGGSWSPIGDVTTIMLWLAHKFEAIQIITRGIVPSLAIYAVAVLMLRRKIKRTTSDVPNEIVTKLSRSEKLVISLVGISFMLPIVAKTIGLPPVLGLLLGLGIVWMVIDSLKTLNRHQTHLTASIEHLIQKTDISSIKFFIGILLAVSALNILGVLQYVSGFLYGADPSGVKIAIGNVILGMVSSVLDNIPLTAIAIDMLHTETVSLWILLAIAVGTGGSLLSVGSAAGVVAMGMIKELTFERYFKIGFVPALVSFLVGISVWALQYFLIFHGAA